MEAKIRELNAASIPAYILHRGEKTDGVVLAKISDCQGSCRFITQQRNLDGDLEWVNIYSDEIIAEQKADDYISRSLSRDPDLWAIEIENKDMNNPFD